MPQLVGAILIAVSVDVAVDGSGWKPLNMGQCDPHVVLSAEFGPATWAFDPAAGPPRADASEPHSLVWERACSGGAPATGRMSTPVRPIKVVEGEALTCPGPPGTPAIFTLVEPLSNRTLLDGGHIPPAPPSPMFG